MTAPPLQRPVSSPKGLSLSAVKKESGRMRVLQPEALPPPPASLYASPSPPCRLLSSSRKPPCRNTLIQSSTFVSVCWFCCPHSAVWFSQTFPEVCLHSITEGCGCLFCLLPSSGDSEPGCLLWRAQFWTTRYLSVPYALYGFQPSGWLEPVWLLQQRLRFPRCSHTPAVP